MKKISKRIIGAMLAIIMVVSMVPNGVINATATSAVAQSTYVTGDIIAYGSYPQTKVNDSALITSLNAQTLQGDSTVSYNGSKYKRVYFTTVTNSIQATNGYYINTVYWFKFETLKWRVLSNTDGELFVLADKILNTIAYNQEFANITWETCTLRNWLNIDFYNVAFNSIEKSMIKTTYIINEDNPWYPVDGGNNTNDKLFLITYLDVLNAAYGISPDSSEYSLSAQYTDFSKSNGLRNNGTDRSIWWLRTPGADSYGAGIVGDNHGPDNSNVNYTDVGVRPAFKINQSSITNSTYSTGDIIEYGSYPQTKVTNASLISALNAQTLQTDSTVIYDGSKYKRVYFTYYIANIGGGSTNPAESMQPTSGYYINTIYWFKFEPIQWRVLSNTNGELFVLADKILNSREYNDYNNITWETCTMRSWLNNDFYNSAFNSSERARIITSTVVNADNPVYFTEGGINTSDKLFLLSFAEIMNPSYGFSPNSESETAREAQGTDFAKSNNLFAESRWWLRSPGHTSQEAGFLVNGGVIYNGTWVFATTYGVRPAMKINLTSDIFTSYSTNDRISFGSYPQTAVINSLIISSLYTCKRSADDTVIYKGEKYKFNDDSWFKFEPITWRVLSNTNGELFVMADKILDSKAYNQVYTDVTWETCAMRSWLNNDFYKVAFSTAEKSQILTSNVVNNDATNGGNNTNDKLFLLSSGEAATSAFAFDSSWGVSDLVRMAQGTNYSKSSGLFEYQESPYGGNSLWWLRSPGAFQSNAGYIGQDGIVYSNKYSYTGVSQNSLGVRPAFKLKLNTTDLMLRENFSYNPDECSQKLAERCADYMVSLDAGTIDKKLAEQESNNFINPFSTPKKYNFNNDVTEDNAGVIFAKKSVIYNNESRTLTIVIISGTLGVQWKGDMDVTGNEYLSGENEEHSSFEKAKNDIRDKLSEYLQYGANSLLLITGFSRGAGVANLLANELTENKLGGKVSDVFAYTFATPNTTNKYIYDPARTNIFNFCFYDDFVTQSLSSWGWEKYGVRYTAIAQDLYQNNDGFKKEMKANIKGRKPDFSSYKTAGVMELISSNWKSLKNYYNDYYYPDGKSLYQFMRNVIAPAGMGNIEAITSYYNISPINRTLFNNIAAYFVEGMGEGMPVLKGTYIADTHNMVTYYTAIKNDGFDIDRDGSEWKTQPIAKSASTDGIASPTNPNQIELQKLIDFAQQGDNLAKLGWDIEDCSTWQGVLWDTETENRICNIDIGFLELKGTLDLADFTSLTNLNCSGNGLTSIDLSGCTSLQVLKCAHNLLTALSVEGITSLTSLDCSWNALETLNIEGCTSLVRLQCNNNELNELTIGTNQALTDLYCAWNNITAIDFSLNSQLINFSCEENCLDIQSGSAMMAAFEQFAQKSGTWIVFDPQKMPVNPVFNVSDITKLTDFANQNGNLTKLKWDLSKPQEWYGVKWIEVNDEYCAERIVVPNLGLVGTLDFSGLANLTLLNCSGNQLSNINVSSCSGLEYLDCRNSKAESLNISSCANLTALNCENNYLDVSEGKLLRDNIDSMASSKRDSVVFEPQRILAEASAFNSTEYGVLSAIAQTGDNLTLLGWDLTKPAEWQGISWVMVNGEYRVNEISMDGFPVTGSIDLTNLSALIKVDFSGTMITSISLPTGMTEIQDWAFYDCSELTSINMPQSIVRIGESAFYNCTKLVVNDLPDSLVNIAEKAFYNCVSLTNITIPDSVSNISMFAFSDCANAANITIPDNVRSISLYAFFRCENLMINCLKGSPTEIYAIKNRINYTNPDIKANTGTNTIVDSINGLVYGLDKNITSLDGLIQTIGGATFQIVYSNGTVCGTGSAVNVLFYGVVVDIYKVIIFGDVNGDGNIDSIDAGNIVDFENNAIPWDLITDSAYIKASDLNGDGNIDSMDAGIAVDVENHLLTIDQSTGIAVPS